MFCCSIWAPWIPAKSSKLKQFCSKSWAWKAIGKKNHALLISWCIGKMSLFLNIKPPNTFRLAQETKPSPSFCRNHPRKATCIIKVTTLMKRYHFCQEFLLWCIRSKKMIPILPNSNDIIRFLRIGGVWVRHANNSCNFDPRTRLGDKCKEQSAERRNTPKRTFLKQQPFERPMWNLDKTTSMKPWWNHWTWGNTASFLSFFLTKRTPNL